MEEVANKAEGSADSSVEEGQEKKPSLTEKLFPELAKHDAEAGAKKEDDAPGDDAGKAEGASDEEAAAPPAEEFIDLSKLKGAKLKLKIDGVEETATLEDVVRRVQFDKHLTQQSQKLAQKESEIKEREKALIEALSKAVPPPKDGKPPEQAGDEESLLTDDPIVKKAIAEMSRIKDELNELKNLNKTLFEQTAESRYQANVKALAERMKSELGVDDLMDYEPRIKAHIRGLPAEEAMKADTADGWVGLYKDMKLKDLMAAKRNGAATERQAQKAPKVEGGASKSAAKSDDWNARYKKAFERARKLSSDGDPAAREAWVEVSRIKSEATT